MKTIMYVFAVVALLLALPIGTKAQELTSLTTLLSTPDNQQSSIAQLGAGKVTVVAFWATWCKPCKEEMKAMQEVYNRLRDSGLVVIFVSIDDTKTMAKVAPYIKAKGYDFSVLLDPNKDMFRKLNGTDVPFSVVYNANGTLHSKHEGYLEGDAEKLEQELTTMLSGGGNHESSVPDATSQQ